MRIKRHPPHPKFWILPEVLCECDYIPPIFLFQYQNRIFFIFVKFYSKSPTPASFSDNFPWFHGIFGIVKYFFYKNFSNVFLCKVSLFFRILPMLKHVSLDIIMQNGFLRFLWHHHKTHKITIFFNFLWFYWKKMC